jgi:membrane protease YdiL (CAAX protease family)
VVNLNLPGVCVHYRFVYATLKWRHHQPVITRLGWLLPKRFYTAVSSISGICAALCIIHFVHLGTLRKPAIPAVDFFVLGSFYGPLLEKSVFRGLLLQVFTRRLGNVLSVIAAAVLFAPFHGPDVTHWVWFTTTRLGYGWLRLASRTTTAAAFMHAAL